MPYLAFPGRMELVRLQRRDDTAEPSTLRINASSTKLLFNHYYWPTNVFTHRAPKPPHERADSGASGRVRRAHGLRQVFRAGERVAIPKSG
jgi:hypothetical protein